MEKSNCPPLYSNGFSTFATISREVRKVAVENGGIIASVNRWMGNFCFKDLKHGCEKEGRVILSNSFRTCRLIESTI